MSLNQRINLLQRRPTLGSAVAFPVMALTLFAIALVSVSPVAAQNQQTGKSSAVQESNETPVSSASSATAMKDADANRPSQFDSETAFGYLKEICAIGPRVSASPGMAKQQRYLQAHFEKIGGKISHQAFQVRSPYNGRAVKLHNLIIQYHPERKRRLLICCHYDTRPFADADRRAPRSKFIGANDGASGVALLCELGKHMQSLEGEFGVDFIFFDGEEFVIERARDQMFLGSTFFSNQYAAGNVPWKYEYGILVDMVADKDLQIYMEGNSLGYADGLTRSVWTVANELGVKEFIPEQRHKIRDDHLPLNQIARIQTCDIIDFDYPNPKVGNVYWHTRKDNVGNCSAESLGKVGSVVLEWIRKVQELNKDKTKEK
ncbi:MAG: M28 family peptidase [Mariniblastus sp.]